MVVFEHGGGVVQSVSNGSEEVMYAICFPYSGIKCTNFGSIGVFSNVGLLLAFPIDGHAVHFVNTGSD